MHYKLWCEDCKEFVSQVIVDTNLTRAVDELTTRHAFDPRHRTDTMARIQAGRLMREVRSINEVLDEFGF